MDSLEADLKEFTARYQRRITQGLAVYGEFDAETDERVLCEEAIEEILDGCGSYMEFLETKHPSLKAKARRIQAKGIVLYRMLKALKEEECKLRGDI